VLDKSFQGLEVLNFIALLNLGNNRRIEGNLEDIHIDWLAHRMQDVYTGLECLLSERLREFESEVLQHYGKHCLAVRSKTLLKVLRNLVDDLESS